MGVMSRDAWTATMLVLQFAGAVYGALIMRDLFGIFVEVDSVQGRLQVHDSETDVLCACVLKRLYTPWQLTMRFTVTSVFCMFLYSFLGVFVRILYFAVCDMCTTATVLFVVATAGVLFGYVFMFVVHFERLRLTFHVSGMGLPKWAPSVLYFAVLLFIVLFGTSRVFRYSNPDLAAAALILFVLEYFVCVAYLMRAFYTKTMSLANAEPRDDKLLATAVRITVVVFVSLLSTTISLGFWVVFLAICPQCHIWELFANALTTFDFCLNSFCLYCTFKSSENRYLAVFGKVHARFVRREVARCDADTEMDSTERVSKQPLVANSRPQTKASVVSSQ